MNLFTFEIEFPTNFADEFSSLPIFFHLCAIQCIVSKCPATATTPNRLVGYFVHFYRMVFWLRFNLAMNAICKSCQISLYNTIYILQRNVNIHLNNYMDEVIFFLTRPSLFQFYCSNTVDSVQLKQFQ